MNNTSDDFLRIQGLALGYDRVSMVEDLNFSAQAGDVIGIIGGNGVGKSTLLRTLAGVIPPVSGDIFVHGRSMAGKSTLERLREFKLTYLPQHNRQISNLTVAENLRLAQWGVGSRIEREQNIRRVLSERPFDQLKDFLNEYANVLSGGQSLLLALATLILQDGRLVLLDEPSDGLDERNRGLVVELITTLKSQQRVILLVEQLLSVVFSVANRVYVIGPFSPNARSENGKRSNSLALRELSKDAISSIRAVYEQNKVLRPKDTALIESLIRDG